MAELLLHQTTLPHKSSRLAFDAAATLDISVLGRTNIWTGQEKLATGIEHLENEKSAMRPEWVLG